MYMRLLGYPSDKITILTTYNGQKHLIRDVVEQRCSTNPFIGKPNKVTTVDKFQGQQNDYILLSLVRTKTVGHIRDVRRLIVAMSRARLGLYVFCRRNLFESCLELEQTFSLLNKHPNRLQLIPNEYYTKRFSIERKNENQQQQQQQEMIIIDDMSKMVKFVFDFYTKQVQRIREQDPELFESIVNPNRKQQVDNEDDDEEPEQDDNQIDEDLPFEKITENDTGLNDDEIIDESMDVDDDDENVVVVVNKDQQQQQQSVSESQESSEDKKSEHEEEEENQQPLQQEEEKD